MNRVRNLALAVVLGAPLGVALWLTPEGVAHGPILCGLRLVFDVRCPFCGMTRSFVALAHGALGDAIQLHPAGPFLAGAMAVSAILALRAALRDGPPLYERPAFRKLASVVTIACLAVGLLTHALET